MGSLKRFVGKGKVRTKTIKRAARVLVEKYYQRLTLDVCTNKRLVDEVAEIQTKKLRNKIAGFTTVDGRLFSFCYLFCVAFDEANSERTRPWNFAEASSLNLFHFGF